MDWPFPIKEDTFSLPFGIRVLRPGQPLLLKTDTWQEQLERKRQLSDHADRYFRALPGTEATQWEALHYLARWSPALQLKFPAHDQLTLEQRAAPHPLLLGSYQFQEDVLILSGSPPFQLIAGAVFFPSGWSVADKIGQTNDEIHHPVPGYQEHLGKKVYRLLEGLKYARPIARDNWGVRPTDRWDQLPSQQSEWEPLPDSIQVADVGERLYFRGEYQTLSRLKHSEAIVFTIHSWHRPIGSLSQLEKQRLSRVLETCPVSSLIYKGIQPFMGPLQTYLQTATSQAEA